MKTVLDTDATNQRRLWSFHSPERIVVIQYSLPHVAGEKNVVGNIVGTYTDLAELMVLAQAGKVTLHTARYPLSDAVQALHDLDAGKVRGRAILVP